jgi:hypothetical protein
MPTAGTAEWHLLHRRSDEVMEKDARQMRGRADPAMAIIIFCRIGFHQSDQFLQGIGREVLVRRDQHGRTGRVDDGRKVGARIIGELRIKPDGGRMCAQIAHQDGIAIRRGARDAQRSRRAASTRHILHHDVLAKSPAHVIRHDARDDIGRPASREGHDHGDQAVGIGLGGGGT